jgi:hypothetical protein
LDKIKYFSKPNETNNKYKAKKIKKKGNSKKLELVNLFIVPTTCLSELTETLGKQPLSRNVW